MHKNSGTPPLSAITQVEGSAKVKPRIALLPAGQIFYNCLQELTKENPAIRILRQVAMPDHVHFEVFITEALQRPLGSYIASLKRACTKQFYTQFPNAVLTKTAQSFFTPGFNDKIAFQAGTKDAFYAYILDNPRRYLIKKLHRDYFYHKTVIEIEGRRCGLYGNIFLLDNPVKSFVKISREVHKTVNLEAKMREWNETIRCGGVLVSPFINPAEKQFRDRAMKAGAGMIIVLDYRFSERAKPYRSLFDLCAEGRLLIVSTEEYATAPKEMKYAHAQELNAIAKAIAGLPPGGAKLLPR